MGVYYTLINLCSIPSIFPPLPLCQSFQQVVIIIILQVLQYWHVCYRQITKDHDSPLSQNLSIANNSALKNRAWWAPPSMAYCQQGSAGNYSCCDCKVASDKEDTTYQPFTLSSGFNITFWPLFCNVSWVLSSSLNAKQQGRSIQYCYCLFFLYFTTKVHSGFVVVVVYNVFIFSFLWAAKRADRSLHFCWELLRPPLSQTGTKKLTSHS